MTVAFIVSYLLTGFFSGVYVSCIYLLKTSEEGKIDYTEAGLRFVGMLLFWPPFAIYPALWLVGRVLSIGIDKEKEND